MTRTRLLRWSRLAEAAVASLAAPRIDVAASDRQADDLVRSSSLFAAGRACGEVVGAAWRDSITRELVSRIEREAIPPSGARCVRAVAAVVTIAATARLMLQLITPGAIGPLNWVLPAAAAVSALAAILWADPIARALKDRKP